MRASKRARHDLAFTPFLSNLTIFVPLEGSGIAHLRTKLAAWKRSVPSAGGILTQDPTTPSITHVLVETLPCNAENLPHHPFPVPSTHTERTAPVAEVGGSDSDSLAGSEPVLVAPSWLEQSLLHRRREPEHQHRPQRHPSGTPGSSLPAGSQHEKQEASGGEEVPPLEAKRRRRWLGEANWRPECATMTQTELVLYGVYNVKRSEKIGNEPVVAALKELSRYERALAEEHTEDDETGEEKMNHRVSMHDGCSFCYSIRSIAVAANTLAFVFIYIYIFFFKTEKENVLTSLLLWRNLLAIYITAYIGAFADSLANHTDVSCSCGY
jgi:ribosomal protein L32